MCRIGIGNHVRKLQLLVRIIPSIISVQPENIPCRILEAFYSTPPPPPPPPVYLKC